MEKTHMPMGTALPIASWLGSDYRVATPSTDWKDAEFRIRLSPGNSRGTVNDHGKHVILDWGVDAVIIKPAAQRTTLIEALAWASEDESREFLCDTQRYRVRDNTPEYWNVLNERWHRTESPNWNHGCVIGANEWVQVPVSVHDISAATKEPDADAMKSGCRDTSCSSGEASSETTSVIQCHKVWDEARKEYRYEPVPGTTSGYDV